MKIFVLIPAYNEKGNLENLISSLEKQLVKLKLEFRVFFVLQGNDGSKQLLEKLKIKNKSLSYLYFPHPLGIGRAYQKGFNNIDKSANYILTMDADLNHDPKEIGQMIAKIQKEKTDLVIGSRFVPGGVFSDSRAWKRKVSFYTNKFIKLIAGWKIFDASSGYRLIKPEVIGKIKDKLKFSGYPFYMEFVFLANKSGFKISEVPIFYHPRTWGKSKIGSFNTFGQYFKFLLYVLANR